MDPITAFNYLEISKSVSGQISIESKASEVKNEVDAAVINKIADEATDASNAFTDAIHDHEQVLLNVVQDFLAPLKVEILKAKAKLDAENQEEELKVSSRPVPPKLLKSLCHFIWEPDAIYMTKGLLQRIYKLINYNFNITEGQSDLDDYMEYKSSEILAYKATQVFIALVLPDPKLFTEDMKKFKDMIADIRVSRDGRAEAAYLWLYKTFQALYNLLSDNASDEDMSISDFYSLSLPSRCVIQSLSVVFARQFRSKPKERLDRMRKVVKDDPSGLEWCLYLADTLRLKRREGIGGRSLWATSEELDLLATAMSMDPRNPFVRHTVIDTIIGCVRDLNGRFHCGDIHLDNMDDGMRYLHSACQKLVEDYPNNVGFSSAVSDYFARFVPLLYFDEEYSLNLLMTAYGLNPFHPKTTHRLGILHRMSLKNIDESLKWFEKTIDLDPYHFQATMEFVKTILGKSDKYNAVVIMKNILESPVVEGWNPMEVADFNFHLGLAHFIKGEKDETLSLWSKIAKINEYPLTLIELQDTLMFYEWDSELISSDKLRLWIKEEKELIAVKEKANEAVDPDRKKFINRLYAFMLGRARPFRSSMVDYAYQVRFPSNYLGEFVVV